MKHNHSSCTSNELDFSIIERQVQVELAWNGLIYEIYKSRLTINQEQIEEQLKLMQSSKKVEEYLISEIIINSIEGDELESKIKEIKNRIEIDGFENVAKDISISESSIKGGDLGWIPKGIYNIYDPTIFALEVGKLSPEIPNYDNDQQIYIFMVSEKQSDKELEPEDFEIIKNNALQDFLNEERKNHDVYAVLDNHKYGDYQPYIYKSVDRGKVWKSITSDLPDRTLTWRIVQDHVEKDLFFAATEYGIYLYYL